MFFRRITESALPGMLDGLCAALKIHEAALPMNQSHASLRGHISKALDLAHGTSDRYNSDGPYIHNIFPGHVVYQHKGETFKRPYTSEQGAAGTDPVIKLGDHKKVHVAYVDTKHKEAFAILLPTPAGYEEMSLTAAVAEAAAGVIITPDDLTVRESATFCTEIADIKEAAKVAAATGKPTTIPIKLIGPGWGSMAYYSQKMIQESGPKVFKKGTHMYWNHATASQEAERPEGDLSELAAVLTKDAFWNESGAKGPGLYSEAKVFSDYAQQVEEKGPHIGVSINAAIKAHEGEAEGRVGRIADSFSYAFSTDFVTKAGAGGAPIVPVQESARPSKETTMTDAEKLAAMEAENVALKSRVIAMEAGQNRLVAMAAVNAVLKESGVEISDKMLSLLCANPVFKEGKVDPAWLAEITGAVTTTGAEGGVRGFGAVPVTPARESEGTRKMMEESFADMGMTKEAIAFAIKGVK